VYRPNKATLQQSAWSSRLPSRIGIHIPQLRVRASVGLTGPAEPLIPVAAWSPEIAFRQRPHGVVVLARFDHADHDLTLGSLLQARRWALGLPPTNDHSPEHALTQFKRLFAGADRLSIQDRWSCYLDITPDMLPVLGRAPGFDGLTIATGLSGHGFAMAPIVGKVTADCALGVSAKFDLSAFSASRW
jgi:glycine/D-amino acid oxidase-like deaminating enzyme